ncbi:MAG: InlB B-repeat-containing protein [Eubacteriales bacterium]|nr:InlB B-repeat-containing protein [Eubacteriales bacterium]
MKKKALAWILALTMTLSCANPIIAADTGDFDIPVLQQEEESVREDPVEAAVQENPESDEEGNSTEGIEEEEFTDMPEVFEDGEADVFSSGEVGESEPQTLFSAGETPLITTESAFKVTSDANGILAFDFAPGETGAFEFTVTNGVQLCDEDGGFHPVLSENIRNFNVVGNNKFTIRTTSNGTYSIKLEQVKPNETFSFKWRKLKDITELTIAEGSEKIIETGVIKGLNSWMQAIECTIHYKGGATETIGNGKMSSEGYSLNFYIPEEDNSKYRCFLDIIGSDTKNLYVDVPFTEKSLEAFRFPKLEAGKVLKKTDFSELYADKFYCFSVAPETTGVYAFKISDAYCIEAMNNATRERVEGSNVFHLEQGNTYTFVLEARSDFSVEFNATKEVVGLAINDPSQILTEIFQGFSIHRIAENAEFNITYSDGKTEKVPYSWQGDKDNKQTYHVEIDGNTINTTVPGTYKAKFYISELGRDNITCESQDIKVKNITEMKFPYIEAGEKYKEDTFQSKLNGRSYCLFTPTETAKYVADCDYGTIGNIFNVKTGQQYGNGAFIMTGGETYCLEVEIYAGSAGNFYLKLNKVKDIERLELLNPEVLLSKVWYKDPVDYLRNTNFRITFKDGTQEKVSYGNKTVDGFWIYAPIEDYDAGNLKPGKRTVKFVLGNYGTDEIYVEQEIEVVEDLKDLQIPTLQLETLYNKNNLTQTYGTYSAGKIKVDEDGVYNVSRYNAYVQLIDDEGKEVYWTEFGYSLKKNRIYLLKCIPGSEEWNFKINQVPALKDSDEVSVSADTENQARLIFKPSQDGVYKIKVPENVIEFDEYGFGYTRICVFDGDKYRVSGYAQDFFDYFSKEKTYEISYEHLKDNIKSFKVSALKKKTIKKIEITSDLEALPKDWIFGAHPYDFAMDKLRFGVTFEDNSTIDGAKLNVPISTNEDEDYTIYSKYISSPPIIGDNDEEIWPGEYKIGFYVDGLYEHEPEKMPDSIIVNVKRINDFPENTFPVLETDTEYSSEDYKPNYYNGKQYVFLMKPQYTSSYDFTEMFSAFHEYNEYLEIVGEDGKSFGYNTNKVGLEAGKTYALIVDAVQGPWSFTIKGRNEIIDFGFADPEQSKKLEVIGELARYEIFDNIEFVITYKDKDGSHKTDPFRLGSYQDDWPSISYDTKYIDPKDFTTGNQTISFYLDGIKGKSVQSQISIVSLKDLADSLPEIKTDIEYTELPENYNCDKCFNFRPDTDGTYLFSFSNVCLGTYAEEKSYAGEWGGRFLRLEAKAGTLYTIYAHDWDEEEPLKISVKKVSEISKLEVIHGLGDTIQWPAAFFEEPDALKNVTCRLTTESGQTEEVVWGEKSKDFGELRYEFVDENGNVLEIDNVINSLGNFRLRFYLEGMPEVKSDFIWCSFCLLKDMGYTKLGLNKNTKVLTPFVDFTTEKTWGALFSPAKTQEYLISCSSNVENIRIYDAVQESGEAYSAEMGHSLAIELEAGKIYAFVFAGEDKEAEIYAKITAAGAIEKITLDTEELVLTPGKSGTVIATPDPAGSQEKIVWSVDSDQFSLDVEDGEEVKGGVKGGYSVKVTPAENADATSTAILTAKAENSAVKATCKLTIANITAEIPKIGNITSVAPPSEPLVGFGVNKETNGQKSDAEKAAQDLQGITASVSEGKGSLGAAITPASGISAGGIEKEIKDTIENGGSIVTEVAVQKQGLKQEEASQVANKVGNQISNASVEQKLDITIDIKKSEANSESKIGNITELPKSKALIFTVLLTQEQLGKKMYVAYDHDGKVDIIPEQDVTQKAGVMTFKANKFSSYYLVSSNIGFTVSYENTTPYGSTEKETGNAYGDLAANKKVSASGYKFLGWYDKATNELWDFENEQITGDVTLVGKWQYNAPVNPPVSYYSVVFDSQGGSKVESQSVTYGQKITQPKSPIKENYTFAGWYKDKACTTPWDFAKDTVTASMTLYAKWDEELKVPDQVTDVTYSSTTGAITLKWKKADKAEGYYIQGRTQGEKEFTWTKTIDKSDVLTCKDTGLKPGVVREYIITPYLTVKGEKVYGEPSKTLIAGTKPGNTSIKSISSKKGYVKVTAAKASGAEGYEYAYSAKNQWDDEKDYKLLGRVKNLTCTNKKVSAGVYAARVRAYKTVEGKRIYGKWSAVKWFEIPTGTIAAPQILKVKVNKNTVTVTLKNVKGATGYDCVLGTAHNPIKPTPYKYIKKNQKTTTIVFKKVKKGTYYVGAHAYSMKGKKTFSKWSNQKKIVVK